MLGNIEFKRFCNGFIALIEKNVTLAFLHMQQGTYIQISLTLKF